MLVCKLERFTEWLFKNKFYQYEYTVSPYPKFCIPGREPREKRLKQVRQRKCRLHGSGAGEEAAPVTDGELQGAQRAAS